MEGKCPKCGTEGNVDDICNMCNIPMEEQCLDCGEVKSKCVCDSEEE
ncbi:hypothetical protein KAR91_44030 [Candidatus Pacearchaeota archaeon]|nr:hypothetical protein [Candidatus Pacearchaeota archaeon]